MADFKDKFSGKLYNTSTYSTLKSAVDSNPIVDGRKHDIFTGSKALELLPYRIKRGDQSKFFPGLAEGRSHAGIETGSGIIRDTVRQIVYVPIKKKNYQKNLIGPGSHISSSFASSAYLQISAAFADKFSQVPDDTIFNFCVEELYNSPSASRSAFNVASASKEFRIQSPGTPGVAFATNSFSTIDSSSLHATHSANFTLNFDTSFATHWQFYSSVFYGNKTVVASAFYPTASVNFPGSRGDVSASLLTDEPFLSVGVNECVNIGQGIQVNGSNDEDGRYNRYSFRFIIKGDADSGSFYQNQGEVELISFPSGTLNHITSSQFKYHATSRLGLPSSPDIRTLYYYSGSGAGSKGVNGSGDSAALIATYKGLFITSSGEDGAPVFKDANFKIPADEGFYMPVGNSNDSMLVTTSSANPAFGGPVYAKSPFPTVQG